MTTAVTTEHLNAIMAHAVNNCNMHFGRIPQTQYNIRKEVLTKQYDVIVKELKNTHWDVIASYVHPQRKENIIAIIVKMRGNGVSKQIIDLLIELYCIVRMTAVIEINVENFIEYDELKY